MSTIMPTATSFSRLYYEASGVAPHVETTRATKTITASAFGVVQGGVVFVKRATAATTLGMVVVKFQLLLQGSDIVNLLLLVLYDNTVNAHKIEHIHVPVYARPGDQFRITTYDGSTGGTVDYSCYFLITEFR